MKMFETDSEVENLTLPAIVYQTATVTSSLFFANKSVKT